MKNKWADQNCRGGGEDESFFWGQCGIRDSHNVFFKEYGICHGGYNNPPHLMNVLGSYIWPFRNKFIPCVTQNTNQPKINIRNLKMNIIEAAEQSERLTLPKIEEISELNNILDKFPEDRGIIFCDESNKNLPLIHEILPKYLNKYTKWAVLIGPEGGFTETEVTKILSIPSSIAVSLGRRILRSDTATTAALFSVQSFIEN